MIVQNRLLVQIQSEALSKYLLKTSLCSSNWLEKCIIVRWFDEDTLTNFIQIENLDSALKYLSQLSFIEHRNYGFAVHDEIRESIYYEIFTKSPVHFRKLHKEASIYYRNRIESGTCLLTSHLIIEYFYHLIRSNENEGVFKLYKALITADYLSQSDLCYALFDTTKDLILKRENTALLMKWENQSAKNHSVIY